MSSLDRAAMEDRIASVARDVEPLLHEFVFVGGVTTSLLVSPVGHLATKLAAYRDRGADDPLASRDLEDVIVLVGGRPEITEEVADAPIDLRSWVAEAVGSLLEIDEIEYVLVGNLPDAATVPGLVEEVRGRLERIADFGT